MAFSGSLATMTPLRTMCFSHDNSTREELKLDRKSSHETEWKGHTLRSWFNRRRAGRTSENDKPCLDGSFDQDLDQTKSLSGTLRSSRYVPRTRHRSRQSLHSETLPGIPPEPHQRGSTPPSSLAPEPAVDLELVKAGEDTFTLSVSCINSPGLSACSEDTASEQILPLQDPERKVRPKLVANISSSDRFIDLRKRPGHMKDQIMMSKKPAELNMRQKLFRRTTGANPFASVSRLRNRSIEYARAQRAQRQARSQASRRQVPIDPLILAERQDVNDNVANSYQYSWDVRGSIASIRAASRAAQRQMEIGEPSSSEPRVITSRFLYGSLPADESDVYQERLSLALDLDRASRLLHGNSGLPSSSDLVWQDSQWSSHNVNSAPRHKKKAVRNVPKLPFKVLEAPDLRDDFYCTPLAYCPATHCLAVALGKKVYLWSENKGVSLPPQVIDSGRSAANYISCLAFSSVQGGRGILAVGRGDGHIDMYSPSQDKTRFFKILAPAAVTHICFGPKPIKRTSQRHSSVMADHEVFLVGDDAGLVSIYFVEWPSERDRYIQGWPGAATLHARIAIHTQQVCGIAWSPDGKFFATGGNDNLCCLFEMRDMLSIERPATNNTENRVMCMGDSVVITAIPRNTDVPNLMDDDARFIWSLNAAVKAIAFCPWQTGLIAAGGGSNDRCIHFYHTTSGASLATIDCGAQVTSLIWSRTRREIAATFGFAQPEHPYRIAVYSWPECQQLIAIPWNPELRALYAIPFPASAPRATSGEGSRTTFDEEGCIVIAASDGSIKFHEIWTSKKKNVVSRRGLLGGSDILEGLHGLDNDNLETIR